MTWRPTEYLLDGELDNTVPGSIVGWLRFAGMMDKVALRLEGDFMPDIRGRKLLIQAKFIGSDREACKYMDGFARQQRGRAGRITSGGPNSRDIDYPYIEWYSESNNRVVLMPGPETIAVVDKHDPE